MPYRGFKDFSHRQSGKIGVLITNLGTPDAPTAPALRKYLAEFLSDPRVVEFPRILWKCILHGIILRIRPRRSAAAYKSVWTDRGSPLLVHTEAQAAALRKALNEVESLGDGVVVDFAMRYGQPSMSAKLEALQKQGVRQLLVLPLYPQYSAATTASTFDAVAKHFMQQRWLPDLRFISHYHDYPLYIDTLAKRIQTFRDQHGTADRLIFSYHGIPLRYLHNGDPYHCECHKTSRLVAEKLGLEKANYMTTFQSRFGREEWLRPYTDETLKSLPQQGVKSVQIICPGFSSDCLETIEEIDEENREYFMEAGGGEYHYIPALNAEEDHIALLSQLVQDNLQGWTPPDPNSGEVTQKHYEELVAVQNG
ncbi:MAG: ferrochelatase [Cellvibrionaceae bacterium]|jgi:ferrochelatase